MAVQTLIQVRRGTASEWTSSNPTLSAGEWGYETNTGRYKIGDGLTAWNSLRYSSLLPKTGDIVGASGVSVSFTSVTGAPVTIAVTGIQSSQVNDFNSAVNALITASAVSSEQVMDIVNSGTLEGNNIDLSYANNKLTIAVTGLTIGTHVQAYDAGLQSISNLTTSSNNYLYTTGSDTYTTGVITSFGRSLVDDTDASAARTTLGLGTISTFNSGDYSLAGHTHTSSNITDFASSVSGLLGVKSLVAGTGIGIVNNAGNQTISVTGIPSSLITDLGNIATTEVVGRTGIQLTYDSIYDKMYIDVSGVSFSGHTHTWNDIIDASTRATLSELTYLSGVSAGTVSASRAVVVDSNKDITGIRNLTTTGDVTVGGNLTIQGTTTTVNSTTVNIGDNIIRVNTSGLTTGGLEVYDGSTTKDILWNTVTNRWEFGGGNVYTSGSFIGSLSGNANTVTNGVYTTDTGTVTSTMIANDTIVNADINSAAAIAYSKLNLSSSIVNADISNSAAIADSKLATISTAGKVSNSATTATSSNTASAIVARDSSGNFSAGTITASLNGNASTVTNGVYTTDTGTVTNTMLAGNIANNKLANSSVTVGSTSISLGSSAASLSGLSTVTATTFVGSLQGTADNVVTNANLTGPITSIGNATTISTGVIDDSHISATGAISYSKLNLTGSIVNADISSSAAIADSKLATISTAGKVSNSATTATSANTASAIVARDSNGDFTAGAITATSFSGSGAALTSLNASNISTGTLNVSRLPTNIPITNLASSGVTIGSTTVNLGQTTTVLNGLTSISGVSAANPTTLVYCVIDGGTP